MNRHFKKIAHWLSLVEGFDASVDGFTLPREKSLFPVRGKTFNFEQMESEYNERRGMGEFATLTVPRKGGLVPGAHDVSVVEFLRVSYMPVFRSPKTRSFCTKAELEILGGNAELDSI
jgi:hypothetical protein